MENVIIIVIGLVVGVFFQIFTEKRSINLIKNKNANLEHKTNISKKEAQRIIDDAKVQAAKTKEQIESEMNQSLGLQKTLEEKIALKQEIIDRKEKKNNEVSENIKVYEAQIADLKSMQLNSNDKYIQKLCERAGNSKDSIKEGIKSDIEKIFIELQPSYIQKIAMDFEEHGHKEAKNTLTFIMQRYCLGSSVDRKEMSVKLPNDKIKGAIIGKEGKNIEYFENLLDVDVLFNHDGDDIIRVSSHDLLKKVLAKDTLELLIQEKSINPETIDLSFKKANQKIEKIINVMGKKAVEMLKLKDVPERISNLFGRFEFRSSYGQNIWFHSMEVCLFSAMLADEIGADSDIAKLAGFTHDLGKAVDLQITTDTGYHKDIAIQLLDENVAEKLNGNMGHDDISKVIMEVWEYPEEKEFRDKVIYAAYCHHEKVPYKNPEDYLVKAADAISASRPGARQETFEFYLTRIKELEELGMQTPNIKKAFSVYAGRELRMIIDEMAVSEAQMQSIADGVAQKIQETLNYPGKIKVNLIRITEFKEKTLVRN